MQNNNLPESSEWLRQELHFRIVRATEAQRTENSFQSIADNEMYSPIAYIILSLQIKQLGYREKRLIQLPHWNRSPSNAVQKSDWVHTVEQQAWWEKSILDRGYLCIPLQ